MSGAAVAGADAGHGGRSGRSAEPGPTSYYHRPILHRPRWEPLDIAGYLFLGGLAGASSVVAAAAQLTDRRQLARGAKCGSAAAIALSFVALVHDLGRPARFANMLRVFKVTSPMNLGSWLLSAFGPLSTVAAASAVTGVAPGLGACSTAGAAVLGPLVAAYTAALVSDTAVPSWHAGYREMPLVFVGSSAAAAAGLGLVVAPVAESAPLRHLGVLGGCGELLAERAMWRRMGQAAAPYREGTAGRFQRAAELLTVAGAVGAATVSRCSRLAAAASGLALLGGSAATRFAIFHAGRQSVSDPRYVTDPQRARIAGRDRDAATGGSRVAPAGGT